MKFQWWIVGVRGGVEEERGGRESDSAMTVKPKTEMQGGAATQLLNSACACACTSPRKQVGAVSAYRWYATRFV